MSTQIQNPQAVFGEAEKLHQAGHFKEAAAKYTKLIAIAAFAPFANYRLAGIANESGDPLGAKDFYYKAFSSKPDICKNILPQNHPNHGYIFPGVKNEALLESCPLCGEAGKAHWCYSLIEVGSAHVQKYNPVRMWKHCDGCNHLFAETFPDLHIGKNPDIPKNIPKNAAGMPTKTALFSYYSVILSEIAQFTEGKELLEVGIGGSECALAAREMDFNVFGIDISAHNVVQAHRYGLNAEMHDFMQFEPERKWDVIIMGDVIEHVSDPVQAIKKTYELLKNNGAIWMSTPNFESAFSTVTGHADPMRREGSHKNYFSRASLFKLLKMANLVPVNYRISSHYNGSMEITIVKEGNAHGKRVKL